MQNHWGFDISCSHWQGQWQADRNVSYPH